MIPDGPWPRCPQCNGPAGQAHEWAKGVSWLRCQNCGWDWLEDEEVEDEREL
jgi:tRNA(Ile2) C34 agmatinyltransferase TiaS